MKDNTIQSNVYELDISDSIKNYWKSLDRKSSDFYCRNCGRFLLDIDESLKGGDVRTIRESLANRNLIVGRNFSGKQFFRVLCWDCFHDEMKRAIEEDSRRLKAEQRIKHTWRQRLLRGEIDNYYPVQWQSAAFYFKFLFDMTDDELEAECSKFKTASSEFFKRKYGETEWKSKFDEYRRFQAKAGCSLDYFVEKYGEEEGARRYREVSDSKAVSLRNSVEKYGDAGRGLFDQYCRKQEFAGCKLEYFQQKYGVEEGTRKYKEINSLKAITRENMRRVHGDDGDAVYDAWKQRSVENRKLYSEISQQLFRMLDEKLGDFARDSMWAEKNSEKTIVMSNGNIYQLDYSIGNKAIEFNGDFWHMNPSIYNPTDYNSALCCCATDKWDKDTRRINDIKSMGYDVFIVWESEFRKDPEMVVDLCCKFMNGEDSKDDFSIFDL